MPKVPYYYEGNWHLVMRNGSLTPICSLSKRSLSPSLTVYRKSQMAKIGQIDVYTMWPVPLHVMTLC